MSDSKPQKHTPGLPIEGFCKLPQILKEIPVGKTTWWEGVKTGRFPKPVKLGRSTFWRVSDIRKLIAEIGGTE